MDGLALIYNKRMNLWIKIRNLIYRLNDFDLHNNENCSFEIKAKHIKKHCEWFSPRFPWRPIVAKLSD